MQSKNLLSAILSLAVAFAAMAFHPAAAHALPRAASVTTPHSSTIPTSARIQPAALAAMLRSGDKPTLLQVGFTTLYQEAHIPGAIHAGPAVSESGLALLRKTAAHLDRHKLLVIYCGCCPWPRCPNIRPAYQALRNLGFTNIKVLYLPHNFGTDWINHGYPTAKGA
jgi:rhodanese-related sulfurtransferase